eukprot:scaffold12567_cov23-Tisochrysis_lutea.AAC.2
MSRSGTSKPGSASDHFTSTQTGSRAEIQALVTVQRVVPGCKGITRYTLEFKLYTEAQHFKSTAINIPPTSVTLPNVAFLQEKRHQ